MCCRFRSITRRQGVNPNAFWPDHLENMRLYLPDDQNRCDRVVRSNWNIFNPVYMT